MTHATKITIPVLALLVMLPFAARAQDYMQSPPPGAPQQAAPPASPQQIDQLVAPIALYPDQLLGQVLMASTYPLEIVEASRWRQDPANAQLQGDQLADALEQQPWDPSVKSLLAFPQVLSMLDNNLQWTEQLGDAFLGQQAAVSDSVQRLRQMAQAKGNLQSTPQQTVEQQQGAIVIQPAQPQVVYVPVYNPTVVYGPWPYAGYPPYYFPPPPGYVYASVGIIGFGIGIGIADWFWGWDSWDWHNHRINIDDRRFEALNRGRAPRFAGGVWAHDPGHRHGVPYTSAATRAQFQGAADTARRNSFRGFATPPAGHTANAAVRPAVAGGGRPSAFEPSGSATNHPRSSAQPAATPHVNAAAQQPQQHQQFQQRQAVQQGQQRQAAPAFESFSRGPEVRAQSQRGAYSRSTTPAAAPAVRAQAPQRSAAPAQHGGGNNGGRGGGNQHDDNSKNR